MLLQEVTFQTKIYEHNSSELLIFQSHIIKDEAVDVSLLLQLLRQRLTTSVTCLGINANECWCVGSIVSLQGSCKLK